MKKAAVFMFLWGGLAGSLSAQTSFWDSPDAYLGQAVPADTPRIFAPGLLADSGYFALDRVAFSRDGKEFYYGANDTWFSGAHLKLKRFVYSDGMWKGPLTLVEHLYAPTFSMDGQSLYLIGGGAGIVSQLKRIPSGWSGIQPYLKKGYGLYDFMPTLSGNIYAGSNAYQGSINDYSTFDICLLSTGDTTIRSLGLPINTPGFNGDFFIAPDESYMVVSAKEQKDYECELDISYRKPDHTWTNPKSLGPLINNGAAHRWGEWVTPDNRFLFYTHGNSEKNCYIFWVRFDQLLENLRHTNFEPYVIHPLADQVATVGRPFVWQMPDHTFVDDDGNETLHYSVTPGWMHLDGTTKTMTGTPQAAGIYQITVTATDTAKATASSTFSLRVEAQ